MLSYVENCIENIPGNISVEKTYSIRKVGGGRGSSWTPKKKKRVLVFFPHSATPLGPSN
jgi:hypothetical protein